ncbi:MAG TPA: ATP-dependent DNA helicase RecG [Thermomicrobiales bacterium]|nr:ATP-dependent DNA helicase RecG [Thermomicrobiales bacterium]
MPPSRAPRLPSRPSTTSRVQYLERAIDALRRVWVGGPDLGPDIAIAVDALRHLTHQIASTHEIAATLESTIDSLMHLSREESARRQEVELLGKRLQAIKPHLGQNESPRELGKLNSALGEKRVGHPIREPAPRRVATIGQQPPETLLSDLPGFGPKRIKPYEDNLQLHTLEDVLRMVPRRHIDYSHTVRLDDPLGLRGEITVRGKLVEMREIRVGTPRVQARLFDGTGSLRITWFSTYITKQLAEGDEIVVSGAVMPGYGGLQITNPEWERVGSEGLSTGGLIPVYSLTKGVTQKSLRKLTRNVLDATKKQLVDWLADAREFFPENVWNALPPLDQMYEHLHYPPMREDFERARRRLMFENLFLLQLGLVQQKKRRKQEKGRALSVEKSTLDGFYSTLPFHLTGAQTRAVGEILTDIRKDQPMTRLLQGDVGSGKTVVAASVALVACGNQMQCAIMAPTELLAEQHAASLESLFAPLPEELRPRVALLTGSTRTAQRREILAALVDGQIDLLIGTHALIQDDVTFQSLGLVVIDEQHRFGVRQRGLLTTKAPGFQPHVLSMTATPIPRSLNLVLHGDLDVSIIDERPPGRIPIETIRYTAQDRAQAYQIVREEVAGGHQVFVICPLVEESDMIEAKAAVDEAQRLQEEVFPDLRVDVLHGKMSGRIKDEVMSRFRDREFDILVSTSVIEVGIDIPNATVMMIEGADRFGLAQLHQFRGRVGRGGNKSYCLLLADEVSMDGGARLHTMVASDDGFVLAERDLELRGPGDFLGTRQSGLPELGWLDQGFDTRILDLARECAERLIEASPNIDVARFQRLKPRLQRFWAHRQEPDSRLS